MYSVGDIIWLASKTKPSVKPYQVVEEITHKTLNGTIKSFTVLCPGNNKRLVPLDELDGDVFTSVDDLKSELNRRASEAIDNMIQAGDRMITEYFKVNDEGVAEELDDKKTNENNVSEDNFVIMDDGTKVKITGDFKL